MDDARIGKAIRSILERGNDVEVRKRSDGSIVILEVKKNKVTY